MDTNIKEIKKIHAILQQNLGNKERLNNIEKLGEISKTEIYYVAYSSYLFSDNNIELANEVLNEGLLKFTYSSNLHYNAIIIAFHLNDFEKLFEHLGFCYKYSSKENLNELEKLQQEIINVITNEKLMSLDVLKGYIERVKKVYKQDDGRFYPIDRFGESLIRRVLDKNTEQENMTNLYKASMLSNINNLIRYYVKTERFVGREGCLFEFEFHEKTMIPLSLITQDTLIEFIFNDEHFTSKNSTLHFNQYNYLNFDKGKLTIKSDNPIFIGKPIPIKDKEEKPYKLVLHIFIDGLSAKYLANREPNKYIDNILTSFNNKYENKNCFATADWTFPSNAGTVTATDFTKHGQYHPTYDHDFSLKQKSLIETIKENGYFTTLISGCWRGTPTQGYGKSYDRVVFKNSAGSFGASEITEEVIDHLEAFKDKNNYVWITLPDLHDVPDELYFSPLSQMNLNFKDRLKSELGVTSVQTKYSESKIKRYGNELNRIDLHLGVLFNYLKQRYSEDEMLIIVHSDHGQGYLTPDSTQFLNDYRTKVPFFLLGGNVESKISNTLMSNLDIYPTILNLLNIPVDESNLNGTLLEDFGGTNRKFAVTETYHPDQTYKIVFNYRDFKIYFETLEFVDNYGRVDFEKYKINFEAVIDISEDEKMTYVNEVLNWVKDHRIYLQK
ncbi:sulfatase-like hydrolase/transferase [Solibacillus cecembensis]|uniref:sulfatase-like hydrolase/transferase n=1 Tax=Solibacillus cecembensis TaxID=459347 RepID=UPI003D02BDFF